MVSDQWVSLAINLNPILQSFPGGDHSQSCVGAPSLTPPKQRGITIANGIVPSVCSFYPESLNISFGFDALFIFTWEITFI